MVTDLIQQLRAALKQPGFTKKLLAEKAHIHPNTLLGCETDAWNPTADTLKKIEPFVVAFWAARNDDEQASAA